MRRLWLLTKPLIKPTTPGHQHLLRLLTTESTHTHHHHPVNSDHLLQVCTILFQQQSSPESRLHHNLSSANFHLTHEFFLQVCNRFPSSWRPVHRFFLYTQLVPCPHFDHTPTTFNKMLDIYGRAKNIDLFWDTVEEAVKRGLVNDKTFVVVLRTLASVRELKKCVKFFELVGKENCSVERLNKVVESLCSKGSKLVEEARFVVLHLNKEVAVRGDVVTYGWLVKGFCRVGDLVEASKMWNLMVDQGFHPGIDVYEEMIETFFKRNEDAEAFKLFHTMRTTRMQDLGLSTYRLVIGWMCTRGKVAQAKMVFDEMRERGIPADSSTLGSLVYGLLVRRRINEAYSVVQGIDKPDISVYHALIKGLVRLKRASEATQVFREMISKGCEPTMHTYVMLLQGHLGKRGRKGPHPLLNFDTLFVGGLVKAGKSLEATKYVERAMQRGLEVPSIKGYRYELWCLARSAGIRYCVLFCDAEETECQKWNEQRRREGEAAYDDAIFEDLARRFERPDRRNRWDSPLFELWPSRHGIQKSSGAITDAVAYLTKKVDSKTRDVKILQPTIATQSTRFSEVNSLYELDRATQEVSNMIVEAQSQAIGGLIRGISLGQGLPTLNISRTVGLPELRRLRRTFIKLTGQTSLSGPPPPSDAESAKRMFVDYLNRELGTA
ncbi:hypothetical protein Tsubulata_011538 [Turnera subulata]|uniref:Pentacotripeptide-repeat region of PRORP domain-containing protein n=1 Tax=Turnera subulata TaxID=218843 RepID=A0A9Q0GL29_9ROSI|nr:hypothetical protein Tsubulata_011538 [Turnera subulata]